MAESIKHRMARFNSLEEIDLIKLLNAVLDDNAALRVDVAALIAASEANTTALDTAMDVLVAKMNLDGGITDADYAGSLTAMTATTATSTTPNLTA